MMFFILHTLYICEHPFIIYAHSTFLFAASIGCIQTWSNKAVNMKRNIPNIPFPSIASLPHIIIYNLMHYYTNYWEQIMSDFVSISSYSPPDPIDLCRYYIRLSDVTVFCNSQQIVLCMYMMYFILWTHVPSPSIHNIYSSTFSVCCSNRLYSNMN